ncbi:MAG: PilW family protein [Vulcanimicrobiota bacterium]
MARRAFTLLEVMVAAGLFLIVGLILVNLLIPTLRTAGRTSQRAQLQQQGLLAGRWLVDDLQLAAAGGVGIRSGPDVLAIQPANDLSADGVVVWQQELVVYYVADRRLWRRTWAPGRVPSMALNLSTNQPTRPGPAQLLQLVSQLDASPRPIAANVDSFTVTHAGSGAAVASPITIELELSEGQERYRLRKVTALRLVH